MDNNNAVKQLTELRESILASVLPLLDSGQLEAGERFDLYSRLAQVRGDYALYEKAFQTVQEMQAEGDKLSAYLNLLGDVDYEIQEKSQTTGEDRVEPGETQTDQDQPQEQQ